MEQVIKLDIEKLLSPISSDNPSGEDLKYEGTYDRILDAKREEDDHLPVGVWEIKKKKADWKLVRNICLEALEIKTKDLQIAVWLLESLIELYGFSGIETGLRVVNSICESFWDDLHPRIENDEYERRISPFVWMNEKLSVKLKLIPVTSPERDEKYLFNWADWEKAVYYEKNGISLEKQAANEKSGIITSRTRFNTGVTLTRIEFYKSLNETHKKIFTEMDRLEEILKRDLSVNAPTLYSFKKVLNDINQFVVRTIEDRSPEEEMEVESSGDVENKANEKEGVFFKIKNRADAYQVLSEAAEYLIRTEPHSPAPYLVKRAILWGNMPLADVLDELVENEGKVKEIYKLLGIKDQT